MGGLKGVLGLFAFSLGLKFTVGQVYGHVGKIKQYLLGGKEVLGKAVTVALTRLLLFFVGA